MGVAAVRGGMAHRTQPPPPCGWLLCALKRGRLLRCWFVPHIARVCAHPNSGPATGHRWRRRGWVGGGRLMAATACPQPRRCMAGHRDRQRVSGRVWGERGARAMWHSLRGAPTRACSCACVPCCIRVRPSCAARASCACVMGGGGVAGGCGATCRHHAAHARSWALCASEASSARDVALSDPGM
jgi:hypothetical protein